MPSPIKKKGTRIPLEQRHLIKSYGRDPIQDRMNAVVDDPSLYTSNDMRTKRKQMLRIRLSVTANDPNRDT